MQETLENCKNHKIETCHEAMEDLTEVLNVLSDIKDICLEAVRVEEAQVEEARVEEAARALLPPK